MLEVMKAAADDAGTGLAVVAVPAAEAADDPGGEGERVKTGVVRL